MIKTLVSAAWLKKNKNDPNLIILDATQKEKKTTLENVQIKGTRFFDIKSVFSDTQSDFPNTLPNPKAFEKACRLIGICNTSKIVVYDKLGVFSSPRVWWMFKIMGHQNIAVLDGGLPYWIKSGFTTEKTKTYNNKLGDFEAQFNPNDIRYFKQIKENIIQKKELVIDVRSTDRFLGLIPESRANLRSGNIPNSINIPYENVLENGQFKTNSELKKIFSDIKNQSLIFSCGSGITACIVYLATHLVLENKKAIYDGSWTEWGTLEIN